MLIVYVVQWRLWSKTGMKFFLKRLLWQETTPFNTFHTAERGPHSLQLCFRHLGMMPAFHTHYFWCLGRHSQTETSFQMNCFLVKGHNSVTSYCVVSTFKSVKIQWLVTEIWVFWSTDIDVSWMMMGSIKLMTWTMDRSWFWINSGGAGWSCFREWWQHYNVDCQNVNIFTWFFLPHSNFAPLNPNITCIRESDSLRITWYKKG